MGFPIASKLMRSVQLVVCARPCTATHFNAMARNDECEIFGARIETENEFHRTHRKARAEQEMMLLRVISLFIDTFQSFLFWFRVCTVALP